MLLLLLPPLLGLRSPFGDDTGEREGGREIRAGEWERFDKQEGRQDGGTDVGYKQKGILVSQRPALTVRGAGEQVSSMESFRGQPCGDLQKDEIIGSDRGHGEPQGVVKSGRAVNTFLAGPS